MEINPVFQFFAVMKCEMEDALRDGKTVLFFISVGAIILILAFLYFTSGSVFFEDQTIISLTMLSVIIPFIGSLLVALPVLISDFENKFFILTASKPMTRFSYAFAKMSAATVLQISTLAVYILMGLIMSFDSLGYVPKRLLIGYALLILSVFAFNGLAFLSGILSNRSSTSMVTYLIALICLSGTGVYLLNKGFDLGAMPTDALMNLFGYTGRLDLNLPYDVFVTNASLYAVMLTAWGIITYVVSVFLYSRREM